MRGQSWVVHVVHLLVSRGGQRVRHVVAKIPTRGTGSKAAGPAFEPSTNVAEELSVPEASQSAAVFAEITVTSAEATTPDAGTEAKDQPLDDSERTANTVGAEVAGAYGADTGADADPNVVPAGPSGSRPAEPSDMPDSSTVSEADDDPRAVTWPMNEALSFTPDDSLNLVDDIEFGFEPDRNRGDTPETSGGWVQGDGSRECPDNFPIKGNGSSHIYHLPGQPSYAATIAERCFATEQDAVDNGFRPTKRNRSS